MIISQLRGLGVVVVTPFLQNGEIDYENLERLVESLIAGGIDYLLALGTNSETPTLTEEEKKKVLQTIIKINAGRIPLLAGLGGPSTQTILSHLQNDDFTGIDAILSVTPYYNKPSQEGLYEHYCKIAYYSPLPVILYNVGLRTACNLETNTTLRLAKDCENIIGIKEASGNMQQIMHLIHHKPNDFLIISGDDAITLPLLAVGIDGLISVISNAFPKQMSEMVHQALAGNFSEAKYYHNQLFDIMSASVKEGNPAGIKAILALQGKMDYYLRLPLMRVSSALQNEFKYLINSLL